MKRTDCLTPLPDEDSAASLYFRGLLPALSGRLRYQLLFRGDRAAITKNTTSQLKKGNELTLLPPFLVFFFFFSYATSESMAAMQ